MANKERNKRSARQARAREREELQKAQEASAPTGKAATKPVKSEEKKSDKAASKQSTGIIASTKRYFGDVRTEMHRVVWPSKTELTNYSVAVIASLVIFGAAVWAVDTGFVALLVAFTGLHA